VDDLSTPAGDPPELPTFEEWGWSELGMNDGWLEPDDPVVVRARKAMTELGRTRVVELYIARYDQARAAIRDMRVRRIELIVAELVEAGELEPTGEYEHGKPCYRAVKPRES
jgi:hypothetical protein